MSETTRPRALVFGMQHRLEDSTKVVQIIPLGQKWVRPGGHMFT